MNKIFRTAGKLKSKVTSLDDLQISTLAKPAFKKLGVIWCLRPFVSPSELLAPYKSLIRPCMEYGSHVWGGSTHTALLNRVESKAFRLINSPPLTDCLDFLSHQRNVAFLSLFYRYLHADCSSELANCMPLPLSVSLHKTFYF